MMKTMPNKYYKIEQHFTGWFPSASEPGQGIAITDKKIFKQGVFGPTNKFPNGGRDFVNPPNFEEKLLPNLLTNIYEAEDDL